MKKEFEFRAITYNEYLDLKNNIYKIFNSVRYTIS